MSKVIQLRQVNRLIKKAKSKPLVKVTEQNVHEYEGCLFITPVTGAILYVRNGSISYADRIWGFSLEVNGDHNFWLSSGGFRGRVLKTAVY